MTSLCLQVLPTLDYSGPLSQVRLLGAGLPAHGFDVHVAGLKTGTAATELVRAGVPATPLGRRWHYDPLAVLALQRLVGRLRPGLVHAWGDAAAAYVATAPLPAGVHRVVSPGNPAVSQRIAKSADRFVVSTSAERDALVARGIPAQRIDVVAYGAPEAATGDPPDLRAELELPEGAALLAAVGPFCRHDDAKSMIWAIDILGMLFPKLHVTAIGGGPALHRAIRFRNAFRRWEQTRFLGPRDDLPRLWPQFTASWVPQPLARHSARMLEAMSAGVPVVAADTPASRELITHGETGFLFPPGARTEMARWTRKLLEDPELAGGMAQAAQHRVESEFSAKPMVGQMAEVYGELVHAGVR